jgi:outer membrane immunogenic protein
MRIDTTGRSLRFIFAAAALVLLGAPSAIADGPRPYVIGATDLQRQTDWTGFYIGGKLGGAWSDISWTQDNNAFTNNNGDTVSFSPSGFGGGIMGGGNVQVGHWVFGAELSFQGVNLSETLTSPFFPATDTFSVKTDWLATVEGRFGYAWSHYLLFGKVGWVGSHVDLSETSSRPNTGTARADDYVDGYTLGGGLEFLTASSFVLGLDYSYINLNLSTPANCTACLFGVPGAGAPQAVSGDATINSVMARASYLFRPED